MWGSSPTSVADTAAVDPANMTSGQREALMDNVKQQIAIANAQELIQRLSDKCVRKCLQKPGQSLDKYEKVVCIEFDNDKFLQQCLSNCMDRFMESWTNVSTAYQQRLHQESSMGGGMAGF